MGWAAGGLVRILVCDGKLVHRSCYCSLILHVGEVLRDVSLGVMTPAAV